MSVLAASALALLAAAAPPAAAPTAIIATIAGRGAGLDEAALGRILAKAIDRRPSLEASRALDRPDDRKRALDCGSSVPCLAELLRSRGAARGLRVALDLRFAPPLYSLRLIDAAQGTLVAELSGESPIGRLASEIEARADRLLESAGFEAMATVLVRSNPPNAVIDLPRAAQPKPHADRVYLLPPGRYTIGAHLAGYRPRTSEVTARLESTTSLYVDLTPEAESEPWLWPAIGIGAAVIAGAAAVIWVATRPAQLGGHRLCVTSGRAAGACPP